MSGALILTGAPGTGKSSVLEALSTELETQRIPFGAIESEELSRGWPWLGLQQWLPQLAAIVSLQRAAGRDTFIVVATTETERELNAVRGAIGGDRTAVVCLEACADVVARRIATREPDSWPGKAALVAHARELAEVIPRLPGIDLVLGTEDRDPGDVAAAVRRLGEEKGVFGPTG